MAPIAATAVLRGLIDLASGVTYQADDLTGSRTTAPHFVEVQGLKTNAVVVHPASDDKHPGSASAAARDSDARWSASRAWPVSRTYIQGSGRRSYRTGRPPSLLTHGRGRR